MRTRITTASLRQAAELWSLYGSRISDKDRHPDIAAKFPGLAPWKCRVLVTIRARLLATNLPMDEAAQQVFGEHWKSEHPKPGMGLDVQDTLDGGRVVTHTSESINHPIVNIDDLIRVSETNLQEQEVVSHRINSWSTVTKSNDGEPKVTRLWQVSATFRPRLVPLVPLDWEPPRRFTPPTKSQSACRQAVILPDMQIGFRWNGLGDGNPWVEPFHDRRAIDIGLQILASVQPEHVILLGDNLDFQPLSLRWPAPPEASQTTAIAITEWRWLLCRIREICPSSEIVYMFGNHEARFEKYLNERAGELKAVTTAEGQPLLSLRHILGLDSLDIESREYPHPYWLWGRVEIEHGRAVRRGGGATAASVSAAHEHSVIYGHIHRQEVAHRTVSTPTGKRELVVGSPGCLCRIDGSVPGADRPDWQQGVGILSLVDGMDEHLDLIRIQNGRAVCGGHLLEGRDYVHELVESTGAQALIPRGARG